MKIVIDIPDDIYQHIAVFRHFNNYDKKYLIDAFKNCIALHENHGRLIDADVFEKRLMDARSYYLGEKADDFDLRFAAGLKSAAERLVDAQTIIEADMESEDKCKNCEYYHNPDYTRCHKCKAESEG